MTRLRLLGLALVGAGALLVGLAPPVRAATLADAGWWFRAKEGPLESSPNPPTVPEGGLYVAGTPDGASALAALRFTLDEGETGPVLTLDVASAGVEEEPEAPAPAPAPVAPPPEAAPPKEAAPVILACQAGSAWEAADGGPWKDKPKVACGAGKVQGEPSSDGTTWEWDLSDLQVKTVLDVVLVPGKVSGVGSTFQIAFEEPEASALQTTPGVAPAPITPAGGGLTPAPAAASDGGAGSLDGTGGGFESSGTDPGASFDAGDDTSDTGPSLSSEEQGLEDDSALAQNAQEEAQELSRPVSSTARNTRTLGIAVLVAGAALALFANQQPVPALRKLGPFGDGAGAAPGGAPGPAAAGAEPAKGGLGRFARVRTGPAPRL